MDKEQYKNLIPSKNYVKTNFMRYVDMVLELGTDFGSLLDNMDFAFDIDNAAGVQLDVIGELVGLKRLLTYAPTTDTRLMTDEEYRAMLKLKIARNVWDGTNQGAQDIYKALDFDGVTLYLADNQDMSVYLHIEGTIAHRLAEIISSTDGLVVPAGVRKNIVIHEPTSEFERVLYQGIALYGYAHQDIGDESQEQPDLDDETILADGLSIALVDGRGVLLTC